MTNSLMDTVVFTGDADGRVWGMSSRERVTRLLMQEQGRGRTLAPGHVLHVNLDFAFDPLLVRLALDRPGTAFVMGDAPVIGQIAQGNAAATTIDLSDRPGFYNDILRKIERPFALRITPQNRMAIERASYFGAYKGVTDLLTKYLWPEIAFHLTRLAAAMRMTPNMVTAIGATLCVVATILFARGEFWAGVGCGFVFMVLDTVDGKLARCTITSSKWGNVFDHGIDLIHPPFWWYAWAMGLVAAGMPLSSGMFAFVMAAIVAGYVVQRVFEGLFLKYAAMDMHVWRRFDSFFRLITARRNPNMVILVVALALGRPDLGLVALAWWTLASLVVHGVQVMQLFAALRAGRPVRSWLEEAGQ